MVDKIKLIALDPEVLAMFSGNTITGNLLITESLSVAANANVSGNLSVTGNSHVYGNLTVARDMVVTGNITFSGFMTGGKIWSINAYVIASNSHTGTISNTHYQKPANLAFIKVTATGSGGGSGCASSNSASLDPQSAGGGSGATCISWFNASDLSPSEQVIVMAGGRGGSNNQNGANGSNSIFGNNSLVIAGGGYGSPNNLHGLGQGLQPGSTMPPGDGGIPYVGSLKIPGNRGSYGTDIDATGTGSPASPSFGGSSIWGSATANPYRSGATPNGWASSMSQTTTWGVGGTGSKCTSAGEVAFGANGGPGVVIVEEYRWPS
jgi:hypothetical protein